MPVALLKPVIAVIVAILTVLWILRKTTRVHFPLDAHVPYLWTLFAAFGVCEFLSFEVGIWVFSLLSFAALKEYFSLVDVRIQDRLAILGAYLSIPFMIYYIQAGWYGMFIISIPVYAFLVVPFLVAIGGGEARGTVFSIGVIEFGLFLFVYCIGHIGYLSLLSIWKAIFLVLAVVLCDLVSHLIRTSDEPGLGKTFLGALGACPFVLLLAFGMSRWMGMEAGHMISLSLLIPLLTGIGRYTIARIEVDLGVERDKTVPGRGLILDTLSSYLYTAPVVFHYVWYFFG